MVASAPSSSDRMWELTGRTRVSFQGLSLLSSLLVLCALSLLSSLSFLLSAIIIIIIIISYLWMWELTGRMRVSWYEFAFKNGYYKLLETLSKIGYDQLLIEIGVLV